VECGLQERIMEQVKTKCKLADGIMCEREGECGGCEVFNKATDDIAQALDLCPVCGADREVWREVFKEEHICFARGK
jgi:hypothetical protein